MRRATVRTGPGRTAGVQADCKGKAQARSMCGISDLRFLIFDFRLMEG